VLLTRQSLQGIRSLLAFIDVTLFLIRPFIALPIVNRMLSHQLFRSPSGLIPPCHCEEPCEIPAKASLALFFFPPPFASPNDRHGFFGSVVPQVSVNGLLSPPLTQNRLGSITVKVRSITRGPASLLGSVSKVLPPGDTFLCEAILEPSRRLIERASLAMPLQPRPPNVDLLQDVYGFSFSPLTRISKPLYWQVTPHDSFILHSLLPTGFRRFFRTMAWIVRWRAFSSETSLGCFISLCGLPMILEC